MKLGNLINNHQITLFQAKKAYKRASSPYLASPHKQSLDAIFRIGLSYPAIFPNIRKSKRWQGTPEEDYLKAWCKSYFGSWSWLPSLKTAGAKKSADDPEVKLMINICKQTPAFKKKYAHIAQTNISELAFVHDIFMNAENRQGSLLEEYIYYHSHQEGWIWCRGKVVEGCDFVKPLKGGRPKFMQIKDRNNSENSSSKSIRKILRSQKVIVHKWYRLKTGTSHGKPYAKSKFSWPYLNGIKPYRKQDIGMDLSRKHWMSAKSYDQFIVNAVKAHPKIIINV